MEVLQKKYFLKDNVTFTIQRNVILSVCVDTKSPKEKK